jgi:lysozyme
MLSLIIYVASLITTIVSAVNAEEAGTSQPIPENTTSTPVAPMLITAVKQFEGCAPKAFWDYGQYSIGYGTRAMGPDETIDCEMEAEQRLIGELEQAQTQVDALGVPLTAAQRAALTSLTFNAGASWMHSKLGEAVRTGNWIRARTIFLQYVRANGHVLTGLVHRRRAEAAWFEEDLIGFAAEPGSAGEEQAPTTPSKVRRTALYTDPHNRPREVQKKQVKMASRNDQFNDDRPRRRSTPSRQ